MKKWLVFRLSALGTNDWLGFLSESMASFSARVYISWWPREDTGESFPKWTEEYSMQQAMDRVAYEHGEPMVAMPTSGDWGPFG